MALEEYVRKRKFEKTPEPPPATEAPAPTAHRAALLRAAPRRHAAALRFPPGDRRRAGFVGRSQRPFARAALQIPGRQSGRSSARIRRIRGQHSGGKLRRGQRHAVGSRHVGIAGRRARRRATRARRSEVPPAWREAEGRVRHRPHEESRQGQRMAAHQEARCRCGARLGHRAIRLERALRPHPAGDRAGLARAQDQAEDGRRSAARMEKPACGAGRAPSPPRPRRPPRRSPPPTPRR